MSQIVISNFDEEFKNLKQSLICQIGISNDDSLRSQIATANVFENEDFNSLRSQFVTSNNSSDESLRSQIATSNIIGNEGDSSLRSQFVTLKNGRGQHKKFLPYAFTELGE